MSRKVMMPIKSNIKIYYASVLISRSCADRDFEIVRDFDGLLQIWLIIDPFYKILRQSVL